MQKVISLISITQTMLIYFGNLIRNGFEEIFIHVKIWVKNVSFCMKLRKNQINHSHLSNFIFFAVRHLKALKMLFHSRFRPKIKICLIFSFYTLVHINAMENSWSHNYKNVFKPTKFD